MAFIDSFTYLPKNVLLKHSHEETFNIAFILNECKKMKFLFIIK